MNSKAVFTSVVAGLATLVLWEKVLKPRIEAKAPEIEPVPDTWVPSWWPTF